MKIQFVKNLYVRYEVLGVMCEAEAHQLKTRQLITEVNHKHKMGCKNYTDRRNKIKIKQRFSLDKGQG